MRTLLALCVVALAGCPSAAVSPADMAAAPADLATQVTVVPQPVWIGSGGSAASATRRLNVNLGGNDAVGASAGAGKASFTPGYFASQTH